LAKMERKKSVSGCRRTTRAFFLSSLRGGSNAHQGTSGLSAPRTTDIYQPVREDVQSHLPALLALEQDPRVGAEAMRKLLEKLTEVGRLRRAHADRAQIHPREKNGQRGGRCARRHGRQRGRRCAGPSAGPSIATLVTGRSRQGDTARRNPCCDLDSARDVGTAPRRAFARQAVQGRKATCCRATRGRLDGAGGRRNAPTSRPTHAISLTSLTLLSHTRQLTLSTHTVRMYYYMVIAS
jgi:hypothetical protein